MSILIVSRFEDESGLWWSNGCRLYDFDAPEPVDPERLEAWMGRPPTSLEDFGGVGDRRLWEPGWPSGPTVEVGHVPAGSNAMQMLGFSGNVMVAQAVGGS